MCFYAFGNKSSRESLCNARINRVLITTFKIDCILGCKIYGTTVIFFYRLCDINVYHGQVVCEGYTLDFNR